MNKEKFGIFLSNLRIERNLTQENVAEALDVTHQTVSKWERGITLPELEMLVKIANFFNVSLYELTTCQLIKNPLFSKYNKQKLIDLLSFKKISLIKAFTLFILTTVTFIICFSVIYSIANFNQVKIYELHSINKNIDFKGYLIKKHNKFYLTLINVKSTNTNDNFTKDTTTKITYLLTNNKQLNIQKEQSFDYYCKLTDALDMINFYISDEKIIDNIDSLELKIKYKNENNANIFRSFKINLSQKYSNNKIFY